MKQKRYLSLIICSFFIIVHFCSAEDLTTENLTSENLTSIHQINLNLVDRLARLEEAQKGIIVEMRTRFEAVDKRFETLDKRFETIDKRFDSLAREMSQRFDTLVREVSQRFESMDKRMSLLENQISNLGAYNFAMFAAIIGLLAYVIWDRKTAFDKGFSESLKKIEQMSQLHIDKFHTVEPAIEPAGHSVEPAVHPEETFDEKTSCLKNNQNNESFSIPENIRNKFRDVVNFMNQFPEMRPIMNAA